MEDVSPAYPLATDATPGGAPSLSLAETQALLAEALQQQQALRQENEQLRTAQHELAARAARLQVAEVVAGMGSYELDLQSGAMHFSEGMYRLFGEAPDSFLPSVAWIDARSDPEDAAAVQRVLAQALHDQQPYRYTRRIRRADGQWRVLESHGRVVADAAGLAMRLEGVVQDKTTQQQTEHDLRASEEQFHLFATISLNPVYKMSADWRQMYRLAGQPFLADTPAATESWMQAYIPAADWPMVSAAIEQATQAKSVFELEHPVILADGSVGWVHSRAVPLLDAQGELVEWLGTGSDITARKLAEQQLQASHELLQATIDSSLDMIQVFEAVRDEQGEIVDFTWLLNNRIAEASYGDVIGQRLLALNPGVVEIGIFDTFKHVVETGQPDQHEWRYVGEQFDGWFYQSTVKLHDGVATTTANITARKQAEQEVLHLKDELTRRAEDKYQALFTAIDEGFCLFELLFDAQGQAVDYRFLEVNSIFEQQTGLTNIIGQLGSSLMIAGIEPHWLDSYAQVVHTGHSVRFENYHQATGRWYEAYASRVGEASQHQVCTVFSDITARKQHEQRQDYLLKLSDALRPLADALQIQAEASRILGEHLGVDRAYYVELHEAEGYMRVAQTYVRGDSPSLAGTYPLAEYVWALSPLRRGETISMDDTESAALIPDAARAPLRSVTIRALIISPLIKSGELAGSLCVTAAVPRHWTAAEVALIQETGERIWGAVVRAKAEEALRLTEQRTRLQKEAFQAAINGEPLASALNTLARMAKEELGREVRTVFYLAYPDGASLHAIAGTGDMPDAYIQALDGFPVGETSFCSGYAIATGRPAFTRDVQEAPLWQPYRQLAAAHHFRACSSYPVLTREGKALGSFALYFPGVHEATAQETAVAEAVTQAAAIIIAHHTEVLEREQAEAALRESEEKYRSLFESIDEGFSLVELLYDGQGQAVDYRHLEVNPTQEKLTGLVGAVGRTARELLPGPEAQEWVAVYEKITRTGEALRREHYSPSIDAWFDVYSSRVGGPGSRRAASVFNNITERKRHEQRQEFLLRFSDAIRSLTHPLDIQRVGMRLLGEHLHATRAFYFLSEPVGDGDWIHHIETDYRRDPEMASHAGRHSTRNFGLALFANAERGSVVAVEDVRQVPLLTPAEVQQYLAVQVVAFINVPLIKDGQFVAGIGAHYAEPHPWLPADIALLQEVAERTWAAVERTRAEEALRESEERLRLALDAAQLGTWDWNLATNEVHCNARHFIQLGLEPRLGPVRPEDFVHYVHPDDRPDVLRRLQAAVEDNQLFEAEFRVLTAQDELRWMSGHGQPTNITSGGRVQRMSGVMLDVTEQKHAEQHLQALAASLERKVARRTAALQQSRDLLQSVYDTTLIGMAVLQAVRTASGDIEDFVIRSVNRKQQQETGRTDLVGRRYLDVFPGVRPSGLLALMQRAVETGQPQQLEYYYPYEEVGQWYSSVYVKLEDGVVATTRNITERKLAERELRKNLQLLEQSEEVAALGSWVLELATGELRWSAGMYRLFGLAPGTPVQPTIYLDYVVAADRPMAERVVQALTTAPAELQETLRLQVGGEERTVRLQTVLMHDEAGQVVRLLGVDLDISQVQRLEADNLRLRLRQQQALIEAVQAAEEEARRRISESLHNGIGQLLYATKLQLDRLPATPESGPSHEANRLLSEAIRQTRALSHELTPATLEEFGLEATLQSICRTLNGPSLHWHCHLVFDSAPALPLPLQLAVYRLAQELAQNVVKHAQATEATLEVEVLTAWVVLRVEDNGSGFDPARTSDGLGLRSLRSRAALLGGSVHLATAPGQGTQCQVRLPLTPPSL